MFPRSPSDMPAVLQRRASQDQAHRWRQQAQTDATIISVLVPEAWAQEGMMAANSAWQRTLERGRYKGRVRPSSPREKLASMCEELALRVAEYGEDSPQVQWQCEAMQAALKQYLVDGALSTTDRVWVFIGSYLREHPVSPSYEEIMDAVGLRNNSNVAYHIDKLVDRGIITKGPTRAARTLRLNKEWPIEQ